jgi:DNA-directed RNA polymerase subunit H (RpoH/RPB5)
MASNRKPLMRCLGEFAGHIIKGVRTPATDERQEVARKVEEHTENGVTLRRTTIDEIELPAARNDDHVSE